MVFIRKQKIFINNSITFFRISSYGRKKRDLSSLLSEPSSQRGDVLVTQAFLVTDKFGKKATAPAAKAVIPTPKTEEPIPAQVSKIYRQSAIFVLLTKNLLLVTLYKYGNFSLFLESLSPFQ